MVRLNILNFLLLLVVSTPKKKTGVNKKLITAALIVGTVVGGTLLYQDFTVKDNINSTQESILTKNNGRIKLENNKYSIDVELENQGYSIDNKFHLNWYLKSKENDTETDVCFISPLLLKSGSKVLIESSSLDLVKVEKHFYCNTNIYGWKDSKNNIAYCNYSFENFVSDKDLDYLSKSNNYRIDRWSEQILINTSSERKIIIGPNNATIIWNETEINLVMHNSEISNQFNKYSKTTSYGNNQYCFHMKLNENKLYHINILIDINKSQLPIKYSVAFGDIEANKIYFVLDPIIIDSRLWTTTTDFNNGTVLTNISSDGNQLALDKIADYVNVMVYYNFDSNYSSSTGLFHGTASNMRINTTLGYYKLGQGSAEFRTGIDDYVETADSNDKLTQAKTVNFWIRPIVVDGNERPIATKWGGAIAIWGLEVDTALSATGYTVAPEYWSNAGNARVGEWKMLTVTFNGTLGIMSYEQTTTYQNATYVSNSSNAIRSKLSNTDPMRLGEYSNGVAAGDGSFYIDEFSVWNTTLTPTQIKLIYDNVLGYPFYYTTGIYSDRQGWCPSTGKVLFNQSFTITIPNGGTAKYRYNQTNSSLDNSNWITMTAGTFWANYTDFIEGDCLYEQIQFTSPNGTASPIVTDKTLYEISTSPPPPPSAEVSSAVPQILMVAGD